MVMRTALKYGWLLVIAAAAVAYGAEPSAVYQSVVADAQRLEKLGKWSASGDAYLHALRLRPPDREAEAIGLRAIQMHSSFHDLGCFWKRPNNPGVDPIPIDGQLAKLFGAYDAYLTLFPTLPNASKIRYQKASRLEECNHFREAADLYRQVYEGSPDGELAGFARAAYRRVRGKLPEDTTGEPKNVGSR